MKIKHIKTAQINTPLGAMIAIADEQGLYGLTFADPKGLPSFIKTIERAANAKIENGRTPIVDSIEQELQEYFSGILTTFKTPMHVHGTPFQINVWKVLQRVPFAHTWSYKELAKMIGNPKAMRAVARANGANRFVIMIPCHRIIQSDGQRGGYSCGIEKKEWLLRHEKHAKGSHETI